MVKHRKYLAMTEEWRTIPGIETHEVSNMGRIRSKDRISEVVADGLAGRPGVTKYQRRLKGRIRKLHFDGRYMQASINDKDYLVHRLVALAFLPTPKVGKTEINHKDGNKLNNVVDNLEWCSRSENELHSYSKLGKRVWNKGTHYPNEIGKQHRREHHAELCGRILADSEAGMTRKELMAKYNLCSRQIADNLKRARELRGVA